MIAHKVIGFCVVCTLFRQTEGRCPNPGMSPGSRMAPEKESYEAGESIRYVCSPSHRMYGQENLVCLENGTWKDPPPVCMFPMHEQIRQIQVSEPLSSPWLIFDGNDSTCVETGPQQPRFWKIIFNRHYKVVYFTVLAKVPQDGVIKWHYGLVSTKGDEAVLLTLDTTDVTTPTHFQPVSYDDGVSKPRYALEFIDNRKYDAEFTFCEAKIYAVDEYECEELEVPDNSKIVYYHKGKPIVNTTGNSTFWWGTIAIYMCNSNYHLEGFPVRNCSQNSSWDGTAPKCVPIHTERESSEQSNTEDESSSDEFSNSYFVIGIILIVVGVVIAVVATCIACFITRISKSKKSKELQQGQIFSSSSHGSANVHTPRSVTTYFSRFSWPHKVKAIPSAVYARDPAEDQIAHYAESQGDQVNIIKKLESPPRGTPGDADYQGSYVEMNQSTLGYENTTPKSMESFPKAPHKPLPPIIVQ